MRNPPTLVTLLAAALALGLAGLLPAVVCLLVLVLLVLVGVILPARLPGLVQVSWGRTGVALAALVLVVVVTAATGPSNLVTGDPDSPLAAAAAVLVVPARVPLGLLAALAAGSLISVTLELGSRRGVQSGLVLGIAVLGLACVAAPTGQRLLIPIVVGWPAALLALTRLNVHVPQPSTVRTTLTGPAATPVAPARPFLRWRLFPVASAVMLSFGLLAVADGSGLAGIARNAAGVGRTGQSSLGVRTWDSKFLGGQLDLNTRGPLGESPVAEVPADSPAYWRTATMDYYDGSSWQVTGTSGSTQLIDSAADAVLLTSTGSDSAVQTGAGRSADAGDGSADGSVDGRAGDDGATGAGSDGSGTTDGSGTGSAAQPSVDAASPTESGSAAQPSGPQISASPADPGDLSRAADPGNFGIGDTSGSAGGADSSASSGAGSTVGVGSSAGSSAGSAVGGSAGSSAGSAVGGSAGSSADSVGSAGEGPALDDGAGRVSTVRTDLVVIRSTGAGELIAPGRVVRAVLPADYGQGMFVSTGDRVVLPGSDGDEYTVTSRVHPQTARPDSLGAAADDPLTSSADIDPRYLQMPASLTDRVRALGVEIVGSRTTRLAAVSAVEDRLAAMMTYTLDAPVPEPGQDAVDYALFESGEGFCEHFASAEVMLLRAAGIPARMVVGYLAGAAERTADGRLLIRQAQAHAWVEVWFPDAGWVTSDATPADGSGQSFLASVNSAFNRAMQDVVDAAAAFTRGLFGPLFLLVALAAGWLFRRPLNRLVDLVRGRIAGRGRADPAETGRIDPHLRRAFARLESALAGQGAARAGTETLTALRDRLIGARRYSDPQQTARLERAFDVLEQSLYASVAPGRAEAGEAAAILEDEAERQEAGQPGVRSGQSAQLM